MMANGLQYRGNDATGVAVMYPDGHTDWFKHNEPAWKFTASRDYEDWCQRALEEREDASIVLVHTRKATKGTPYKPENNHPLVGTGKSEGALIIHNGMISNDDSLFALKDWKRHAETDSDIIRAILDDHGGIDADAIEAMGQLQGFAAIAAIHPSTPDKLLSLRDSNPIMVGGTDDYFAFASDKKVITQVCTTWISRFGIPMRVHAPNISFVPMANETGWIIDTTRGLEYHAKFQCNGTHGRGNTRYSTDTSYHERQERFAREADRRAEATTNLGARALGEGHKPSCNPTRNFGPHMEGAAQGLPDYVICPNFQCSKHVRLSEVQRLLTLERLSCKDCSTSLANAVSARVAN
jgi:asparagine synthetase B (glutamine-hydrolysing)